MKGDLLHRLDYRTVSELSVHSVRPMLYGMHGSSVVLGLIKVSMNLCVYEAVHVCEFVWHAWIQCCLGPDQGIHEFVCM